MDNRYVCSVHVRIERKRRGRKIDMLIDRKMHRWMNRLIDR